jgi:hypothetical protein
MRICLAAIPDDVRVKLLTATATDDEVVSLCREWVELVAADRLGEAIALLWVPPDYDQSQHWTPESLRRYIENYGSRTPMRDGSQWRITSTATARVPADRLGFAPRADVVRLREDPRAGSVDFDVPLNGEWSDLTAQFEFRPIEGGTAVSLYDLHVL